MRFVINVLFFLLILFCARRVAAQNGPSSELILPGGPHGLSFKWAGDSINGKWDEHAAILVPVKLKNCPQTFYMQFDLGSPSSIFYTNKLKPVADRYKSAVLLNDTASTLTSIDFSIDDMAVSGKELVLRNVQEADARAGQDKGSIIGTLGVDLLDNRQVLIDYPNRKIWINYQQKENVLLADLVYGRRSILFPAMIKGKSTMLFFDTGSSAFELLTDKSTALTLAIDSTSPVTFKVRSWDRMLDGFSFSSNDSISFAQTTLPLHSVTYIEGASDSQVERMRKIGIGGMTGNKLFIHSRLLLDLANKKFAILPADGKKINR
jgi:hypothetical protein